MNRLKQIIMELDAYIKNTRTLHPAQKTRRLAKKKKSFKIVKEIDPVRVVQQYAKNKGK